MALLDYGFDAFETHKLYSGGQPVAEARVFKGKRDRLPLGPASDVYVTVPRGEYENLGASAALTADIVAPLARDQVVGDLMISLGGESISRLPLVALETVDEGWILRRVTDGVALLFE
jgi:D-alanyl-D-alanine carboxypeptidase (penicillin-binding protein 5/6)